jgi:hypothetical protein
MAMTTENDVLLSCRFFASVQAISSPRLSYQLLPVLNEGGHKIGHSRVVRIRWLPGRGQASGSARALAFFLFCIFCFLDRPLTLSERYEPRITIVVERPYRSTLSSIQMPPDSSAMVNTSLSWVSESPTGIIHRGTISLALSNFDT